MQGRLFIIFATHKQFSMKRTSILYFLILFSFLSMSTSGQNFKSRISPIDSGQILFQVDMSQWAASGKFNPATDSIDMPGTFNNWQGSAKFQLKDSMIYQLSLLLDSLTVQQFRFRINRDTNHMEFPGGQNRMIRIPGHPITVRYHYNDFDTTTVPITFRCNMYYQIRAFHFDPQPYKDFV